MYNGVYTIEQYAYMNDTLTKWLARKVDGAGLGDRLQELGIQKLAIYGINGIGKLVYQDIKQAKIPISCFVDKRAQNYPNGCEGLPVLGLNQLSQLDDDCYVLVTPEYYFYDILQDLLEGGIPLERIISLAMVV